MQEATLAELKALVLEQADMTSSSYISDTTLEFWINAELSELHDLLVGAFSDYYLKRYSVPVTSGAESFALPDDFYKLLKVYLNNGTDVVKIPRFTLDDLDALRSSTVDSTGEGLYYRVMGNRIYFYPVPTSSLTVELWYAPHMAKLVNDVDRVSIMVPVGWEDFVVCGAAARCLMKEESDPSPLLLRKEQIRQRIMDMATSRDEGEAETISGMGRTLAAGIAGLGME